MEAVFLLCTDAVEGPDGKLDIRGVLSELHAPDFPARQDRLVLAGIVEWDRVEHGRIPFRMELSDPEGMSIFTIEGHTDVTQRSRVPARTQFVLPLKNVMFPAPGRYRVRVDIDGSELPGPNLYLLRSTPAEV